MIVVGEGADAAPEWNRLRAPCAQSLRDELQFQGSEVGAGLTVIKSQHAAGAHETHLEQT